MNLNPIPPIATSRRKGLALVTVLSMMALTTILVLAFFSLTESEYRASQTYATGQAAKAYADTALNIVISQIRSAAERGTDNQPVIHATQPGCVRKYNSDGAFMAAYKLYSDANMVYNSAPAAANGEQLFFMSTQIPAGWNAGTEIYRYADINEPVVRALAGGGTNGGVGVYFPVIDPRAAYDITPDSSVLPVEGFSYAAQQAMGGSTYPINGVIPPGPGGTADSLRLPMPVQWLYLLKDGSMGTLDSSLAFVGAGGVTPSADNPMVARIAFWTDDETCKVNINTASEPTFMGQPLYYHEREHQWVDHAPTRDEFQRYPGHPATVALSTIFYPNPYQDPARSLEMHNVPAARIAQLVELKNQIYRIMPRINDGGSLCGTKLFADDDYASGTSTKVTRDTSQFEHLYASVDELMFSGRNVGLRRDETDRSIPSLSADLFDKNTLERASAFLTAQSRASEVNMFGYPKVAMWPIADESLGNDRRTRFDRLIAFCSSLSPTTAEQNDYFFRRAKSTDANYDVNVIQRNAALMQMLDTILATQKFPPTSYRGGVGNTFAGKYGAKNARQILVQIFDYIRTTNLYDGVLAPLTRDDIVDLPVPNSNGSATWRDVYIARDAARPNFTTYTPGVFRDRTQKDNPFFDKVYPGHGQVASSSWRPGGTVYKGIARDLTISEIGLHFICTGDGQNDKFSWRIPQRLASPGPNKFPHAIPVVAETDFDGNADISGGRTALEFSSADFTSGVHNPVILNNPRGFSASETGAYISDMPGDWGSQRKIKNRFYSNYPFLSGGSLGMYGTVPIAQPLPQSHPFYSRSPRAHPGYNPENWNCTLQKDTPLGTNEKRIQVALHLELFSPSVGYTQLFPEYTLVLVGKGVSSIEVDGKAVFSTTTDIVIKSNNPIYEIDGAPEVGGYSSFRQVVTNRRARGVGAMPSDDGYDSSSTKQAHEKLLNMDLLSSFFTVKSNAPLEFNSKEVEIRIYDTHNWQAADPVQTVFFTMPTGLAPVPDLVVKPSYHVRYPASNGVFYDHPQVQAPRWWAFHRDGALGRFVGEFQNPQVKAIADINRENSDRRGRLYPAAVAGGSNGLSARDQKASATVAGQRLPGARSLMYGAGASNDITGADVLATSDPLQRIQYNGDEPVHYGSDSVRSLVPGADLKIENGHGDARLLAAKSVVTSSDWSPHPLYGQKSIFMAHNFSTYTNNEPGFDVSGDPTNRNQVLASNILPSATMGTAFEPDAVHSEDNRKRARRYGDYEDSDPGGRVGGFLNKPDEGNYAVGLFQPSGWTKSVIYRLSYFSRASPVSGERFAATSGLFFSPNRLVTSPVMFGALPSNVWGSPGDKTKVDGAWQTLLFRPHVQFSGEYSGEQNHPGEQRSPADHNLLELFWMPVVEPYAISEPLSTAGKINMNYQMLPFAHIRRATALHALMKGEMFQALPNTDYSNSKNVKTGFTTNGVAAPIFRGETPSTENKFWHRNIVIDRFKGEGPTVPISGTLAQFDERFEGRANLPNGRMRGLFRTPSQICELYLIPSSVPEGTGLNVDPGKLGNYNARKTEMAKFWTEHSVTGDNTRERPYSNLYARLTTRSNTFRVHVRAETVRKARSSDPTRFEPSKDSVAGEYRGSFLIERYIDFNDKTQRIPDYASTNVLSQAPLESFYRFRVLESKRFSP